VGRGVVVLWNRWASVFFCEMGLRICKVCIWLSGKYLYADHMNEFGWIDRAYWLLVDNL